jgi:hypothetical protein
VISRGELKETEAGLVPASEGWFVLNARDARWFDKPGQGHSLPLTGHDAALIVEGQDGNVADARFAPSRATRYPGGLLPR